MAIGSMFSESTLKLGATSAVPMSVLAGARMSIAPRLEAGATARALARGGFGGGGGGVVAAPPSAIPAGPVYAGPIDDLRESGSYDTIVVVAGVVAAAAVVGGVVWLKRRKRR